MHSFHAGIEDRCARISLSAESADARKKKVLKIAGNVENSGKQVVKRPRVLTPQCWKHCVLRGSFSEKFDTTNQNHYFCKLLLQNQKKLFFIRVFTRKVKSSNLHRTAKHVNLHANGHAAHLTEAFCEVKFDFCSLKK